ncbi:hypothetical protein PB2503_02817 [Parvularcula bermudensis HTCC2503]|uniref:DUF3429 domain-containing protein n=1 Tax=Parvularcula bermudensis (strain ATCC BAA-594 / HTCC2503 / KCTC 12087) TaxID=314260 RepID=E0TCQ1_PARBH|nr:DUF3429 domain-containing protein [Parvularcula bermudensis]ADM08640.1 hypothetical protein PB2503_02817 [Parvularcula bermudensis HTCC2503]
MDDDDLTAAKTVRFATFLGALGVISFAVGALAAWVPLFGEASGALLSWILVYGAVILSFMAGTIWGVAIKESRAGRLVWAVIPALVGWAATLPPYLLPGDGGSDVWRLATLIVAFGALLISELIDRDWDSWYLTLRVRLSLAVMTFLLITMLRLV